MIRHTLSGTVAVPLSPDEALALFTPAGERAWAPGWNPVYPAKEDTTPGTTFTTHEGRTFWVIADRTPPVPSPNSTEAPCDSDWIPAAIAASWSAWSTVSSGVRHSFRPSRDSTSACRVPAACSPT